MNGPACGVAGKVFVVTGASRGLGLALARGLSAAGGKVVAMSRSGRLRHGDLDDQDLHWVDGDIRTDSGCDDVVKFALEHFGRVDAVINNAALGMDSIRGETQSLWDTSPGAWTALLDTNIVGAFRMSRAALPPMRRQGGGLIVNVSTSPRTMTRPNMVPYGPSKAALDTMTVAWATDLAGANIRANVVIPGGACSTDMIINDPFIGIPAADLLPPDIVLPPVKWLLEPEGLSVNGSRLVGKLWPHAPIPIEPFAELA